MAGDMLDDESSGTEGLIANVLSTICGLSVKVYSEHNWTVLQYASADNAIVRNRGRWLLEHLLGEGSTDCSVDTSSGELIAELVEHGLLRQELAAGDAKQLDAEMVKRRRPLV